MGKMVGVCLGEEEAQGELWVWRLVEDDEGVDGEKEGRGVGDAGVVVGGGGGAAGQEAPAQAGPGGGDG